MLHSLMGLGVVGLLGLGAWIAQFLWHRAEVRRLNMRESLAISDLYARYYATSGLSEVAVADTWREIATTLKVPVEKLRPSDKFGVDVGTYLGMSVELDTLSEKGAERARQRGLDVQLERLATVDDYVRALASRE